MQLRAVALAMLVLSSTAHGDTLRATRAMPLSEIAHTVDVAVADGVATYTVRRVFMNAGAQAEQVELEIDLPYGAAATGLRIYASGRWWSGVLLERETAERLYQELTGLGTATAKDPALLSWMWADQLGLRVFPVPAYGVSTVEYTLTAPTRYERGHYFVSYPRVAAHEEPVGDDGTLRLAPPIVTVRAGWTDARIALDNVAVAPGTRLVLGEVPEPPWEAAIDRSEGASYVASTIEVPATARTARTFTTATVLLDIAHTYRSDVKVELVTPGGEVLEIDDRTGGTDNGIAGKRVIELPAGTATAGTWRLVVSDHAARDTGSIDRWSISFGTQTFTARDTPMFIPDAPESASKAGIATISITAPPIETLQARFGRVVASTRHVFGRVEIDVAPVLVPVPKRAQVVFAIDTSYSQGDDGVAAQLAVALAYLTHVPDAEIEIVAYQRHARRVFGRFVPASAFAQALTDATRRGAFALGNGSALDAAADAAVAALALRTGPRRLVMFTDERLRTTLVPATATAALAALSPETIVHVVVPSAGSEPELVRRDEEPFAPLATNHHGIYVHVTAPIDAPIKRLAPTALELVRPTRIAALAVAGVALARATLHEGDGVRLMRDDPTLPAQVAITGKLWSDPIRKVVAVDPTFSTKTAAFVFGEDQHHDLSDGEMRRVATLGRAVSPVTSYLATEPGVRPSTEGIGWAALGTGADGGLLGHGSGTGSGYGSPERDLEELIDLSTCVARLRPTEPWSITLEVERTGHEIVDVIARSAGLMVPCLVETVWALKLDETEFYAGRHTRTVTLRGPAVAP